MNKENKPKKEFSKKIFNIVITLFIIVIFYAMALMWKTNTTDGLMYLIPAVGTLASVTIGFYYWKSKNENRSKYAQKFVKQMADKYGIEAVCRICELVLKD